METRFRIIVIAALLCCVAIGVICIPKAVKYDSAFRLMEEGQYSEALELFNALGKYNNAEVYSDYCSARLYAAEQRYSMAGMYLARLKYIYKLPYDYLAGYEDFVREVEEQQEIARQEAKKAEEQRYKEQVRTGIPFVGMYESDIGKTTLGKPNGTPFHNYEMENGKPVEATVYEWIKDGYVVYSARCLYGTVEQVWDYRTKPWKKAKSSSTSISKSSSSSTKKKEKDPLDVESYRNPEDFYDDNYYDFFDYEEAAEYYYEHGGK